MQNENNEGPRPAVTSETSQDTVAECGDRARKNGADRKVVQTQAIEGGNGTGKPSAPSHQITSTGGGEHKCPSDKGLDVPHQLATKTRDEMDPVALEAAEMLASPDLPRQIIDDVHSLGVVGEDDLILMIYVTATARLMPPGDPSLC